MYKRNEWKLAALFLVVPILVYALIVVYPSLRAFYISLFRWRGVSAYKEYVGLWQYEQVFGDPVFWVALRNNFAFMFLGGSGTLILGLFLAIVLSRKVPGSRIYRIIFFLPYPLSLVCIAVLWMFMYNPSYGAINSILNAVGLSSLAHVWLGEKATALPAVIAVMMWGAFGFYMVFFLGGIQRIPQDCYDAAKVDGASEIQLAMHVTLPLLWEYVKTASVFLAIRGLNEFVIVQVMTFGMPAHATEVVSTYLYRQAFWNSKFGLGTAMAVCLFLVTFIFIILSQRLLRREVVEY